ncbi:flagellar basal body P-ring formation chaperone FlgA [Marinovum sp.]|uniref:flagellar basal body P-ring formation chaperone FlgA n=1 Tax=Marinovum sp. TaxID=2024839 RepID=UPI002B2664B9|nr:flagellar basal body P-ring formation chaperone FlgA [Marinovum sp.]
MRRALALILATLLVPLAALAETPAVLIEEQVRQTLGAELPPEAMIRVRFKGATPEAAEAISAFWMDRDSGQFLANAVTETGVTHRLAGMALAVMALPVPAQRLMPGAIIGPEDIVMTELSLRRVGAFTITDPTLLEGMQVRRMLAQGRPVMTQSVMQPLVIDRGDKVSILYDDGRLVLTAPGRALDSAHRGAGLRIVNLVSNAALEGIARGPGLVEVIR